MALQSFNYGEFDVGGLHDRMRTNRGEVVAIKRYVESADGDRDVGKVLNDLRQTLRQRHSPPTHADKGKIFRATRLFDYFVRDPLQCTVDFLGGKKLPFFYDAHSGGPC